MKTPFKFKASIRQIFVQYALITVGLFIFTAGWTLFLIPAKIVGGGLSGISTIILLNTNIPVGVSNFVLNGFLVLISMKIVGPRFGLNSIYGIVVTSLFFILEQEVLNWDVMMVPTCTELGPLLCAIIGSLAAGSGIGMAIGNGGNSGGTDIIALMVTKYHNISPGKILLFCDLFIVALSIFTPEGSWVKVIYGYIVMGVFAATLDFTLEGNKQSYQIMVFSRFNEDIAESVVQHVKRGVTLLEGKGGYSKIDQKVLVIIVRKYDKRMVMKTINSIDKEAFVSISKVQGVFGKNFDSLKA